MNYWKNEGGGIWWDHRVWMPWDLEQRTYTYTLAGGYYEYGASWVHMNTGALFGKNHANINVYRAGWNTVDQHISTIGENFIEAKGAGNYWERKDISSNQWVSFGANKAYFNGFMHVNIKQETLGGFNEANLNWTQTANVTQCQFLAGYNVVNLIGAGATINQWASIGANEIKAHGNKEWSLGSIYVSQKSLASFNLLHLADKRTSGLYAAQTSYIGGWNKIENGGGSWAITDQYTSGGGNEYLGWGSWGDLRAKQKSILGANIFKQFSDANYLNLTQEMYAAGANYLEINTIGENKINNWSGIINQYNTIGHNHAKIGSASGNFKIDQNALAAYSWASISHLNNAEKINISQSAAIGYNSAQLASGSVKDLNIIQMMMGAGVNEIRLNNSIDIVKGSIAQSSLVGGGVNNITINTITGNHLDLKIIRPNIALLVANYTKINDLQSKGKVLIVDATAAIGCVNYVEINNSKGRQNSARNDSADITAVGVNLAVASANVHKINHTKSANIFQLNAFAGVNYSETNGVRDTIVIAYNSLGANISIVKTEINQANNIQVGINLLGANVQYADAWNTGKTNVQVAANLGGGANFQYGKGYKTNFQIGVNNIAGLNIQLIESNITGLHVQFAANAGLGINTQYIKSSGIVVQAGLNVLGLNAQIALDNGLSQVGDGSVTVQVAGNGGGINLQYAGMGNTVVQFGFNVMGLNAQVINSTSTTTAVQVAVNAGSYPSINAQVALADNATVVVQASANYIGANLQAAVTGGIFSSTPSGSTTLVQAAANYQGANIQFGATNTGTTVQFAINVTGVNAQAAWSHSATVVQVAGNKEGINIQFAKTQETVVQVAGNLKGVNIQVALDAGLHVVVGIQVEKGSNIAVHVVNGKATTVHLMGAALGEMLTSFKSNFNQKNQAIEDKAQIKSIADKADPNGMLKSKENDAKNNYGKDDFDTKEDIANADGNGLSNSEAQKQGKGTTELDNSRKIQNDLNKSNLSIVNENALTSKLKSIDSNANQKSSSNNNISAPSINFQTDEKISAANHDSLNKGGNYKQSDSYTQLSKNLASSEVEMPASKKQEDYSTMASSLKNSASNNADDTVNSSKNNINPLKNGSSEFTKLIKKVGDDIQNMAADMFSAGGGINVSVAVHDGLVVQVMAGFANIAVNVRSGSASENIGVQVMLANNINLAINTGTAEDYIIAANTYYFPTIPTQLINIGNQFLSLGRNAIEDLRKLQTTIDKAKAPSIKRMTEINDPNDTTLDNLFKASKFYKGEDIAKGSLSLIANLVNMVFTDIKHSNIVWAGYGHDVIVAAADKNLINAGDIDAMKNFNLKAAYKLSSSGTMLSSQDIFAMFGNEIGAVSDLSRFLAQANDGVVKLDFKRLSGTINDFMKMGTNGIEWQKWALKNIEMTTYQSGYLTEVIKYFKEDSELAVFMKIAEAKSMFEPMGMVRISSMDSLASSLGLVPFSPNLPYFNSKPNVQNLLGTSNSLLNSVSNISMSLADKMNISSGILEDPSLVISPLLSAIDVFKNSLGDWKFQFRTDYKSAVRDDNLIISLSKSSTIFTGDGSNIVFSLSDVSAPGTAARKEGDALITTNIFGGKGNDLIIAIGDNLQIFGGDGNDMIIAIGKNISIDSGAGDDVVLAMSESMLSISTGKDDDLIFAMHEGQKYNNEKTDNKFKISDGNGDDFAILQSANNHEIKAGSGSNVFIDLASPKAGNNPQQASLDFLSQSGRNYLYTTATDLRLGEYANLAEMTTDSAFFEPLVTTTLAAAPGQTACFSASEKNDACRYYGNNMDDRFLNLGKNTDMWGSSGADSYFLTLPTSANNKSTISSGTVNDFEWGIDNIVLGSNITAKALSLDAHNSILVMYASSSKVAQAKSSDVSFVVLQSTAYSDFSPINFDFKLSSINFQNDDLWKSMELDELTNSSAGLSHYSSSNFSALFDEGKLSQSLIDQAFKNTSAHVVL